MARSVWCEMVSGFGKHPTRPSGYNTVMSSDRNRAPPSRTIRSTVPVLPVSVSAEISTPTPSTSRQAECSSIAPFDTATNRSSASRMFV